MSWLPRSVGRLARSVCPLAVALGVIAGGAARAADVHVANAAEFRAALAAIKPGTRVLLAPGDYGAGFQFRDVRGEPGRPIVIAAADPQHRPRFADGSTALHFSNPAYLELRELDFTRLAMNGINLDDGGRRDAADARGILLAGLRIRDVGTTGNQDGIKLSGVNDFEVRDCTIERWGRGGGSAIDLVGCHRGVIEGCLIRHEEPAPGNCTGVQGKGGTSEVVIRRNRFEHAGGRAVNIGGSTGLEFFRPPLVEGREHAEARAITVEGNTFVGGVAPVAFVGVDGAVVRFNTFEEPGRWVLRILQETRAPGFVPSRRGEFTDNLVIFTSTRWAEGGVNVGSGTAPETFVFARNAWYCVDRVEQSRPKLPTTELGGVYGLAPDEVKQRFGAEAWSKR